MSAVKPLMWVVEWIQHGGTGKRKHSFLYGGTAQAFIDGRHEGLAQLRSSLSDEEAATLTLKRAPFANRLEGWLKALRKNGIRSRKNLSQAAMSKMNRDAPTVFHTGYQGYAYEASGDEVYRKSNGGHAVRILHFNHDNMTPAHYQTLRELLDAYGLPYAWDGTTARSIQIITPHGERFGCAVCDFCEELMQKSDGADVDGFLMCKACVEASE